MSHFIGLCFGEFWEQNLEQYDESLEVEEYVSYTEEEAIKYVKEYYPEIQTDEEALSKAKEFWDMDENNQVLSTYNPDSRWDWYSVGGRWGQYLPLKEEGEFTNEATVGEIDWDKYFNTRVSPFCFVTEDGEWIEKGEMGWWCAVGNEMDTESWNKVFKDYVQKLDPETLVVAIDFHI